jgi:hypothetical protein
MASWYAFNPISLFISSYHGQQESFWLFFILAAYTIVIVRPRYNMAIAAMCGIALSYKLPAALLLLICSYYYTPFPLFDNPKPKK